MEIEFSFPALMLKFFSPVELIYREGRRWSRALKAIGDFALLLSFFGMLLAIDFLARGAVEVLNGAPAQVSIAIPGLKVPGSNFSLPLAEGLIVIFLLALFHEGMHGLMAAAHGIKPSFFAFILFLFIPAAGVEIDEEKLKKLKKIEKARIFAAGSFGNIVLALLAFLLLFPAGALLKEVTEPSGLLILNVTNPAINLSKGYVIEEINGTDVRSVDKLLAFLDKIRPGEIVEIKTKNGTFIGKTINKSGKARLGVYLKPLVEYKTEWAGLIAFIARVLLLSFQINIGVALINLLPVKMLDGGRIAEEMSEKIIKITTPIILLLLLFNMFGPYLLH